MCHQFLLLLCRRRHRLSTWHCASYARHCLMYTYAIKENRFHAFPSSQAGRKQGTASVRKTE